MSTLLDSLERSAIVKRIWERDPTVWSEDPAAPEIGDRLGWLALPVEMQAQVEPLNAFADEVHGYFDRVVLLGMGGSSLAPEVLCRTLGQQKG